jgi:hypothetical protein
MKNTIYFDKNKNPYHPYTMSEKASTHPGYRFSRTLENLRKRHVMPSKLHLFRAQNGVVHGKRPCK